MKISPYTKDECLDATVSIERAESKFGGWDYTIYNRETGVFGHVEVRHRNLLWFEERSMPVTAALTEVVDDESAVIAEIPNFEPHGDIPNPRSVKRGVGTAVLRRVCSDAKNDGVGVVYGSSPKLKMESILLKNGFDFLEVDDTDSHLLKVL